MRGEGACIRGASEHRLECLRTLYSTLRNSGEPQACGITLAGSRAFKHEGDLYNGSWMKSSSPEVRRRSFTIYHLERSNPQRPVP